jgi:crossover junction endodeoxyribonuclease RusA
VDEIEFRVTGTPISHQGHNKPLLRQWRENVAAAARAALPDGFVAATVEVEVQVVYYFEDGPAIPDEDNLLKPIQDALRGIVYADDDQVVDGTCCKRNIDGAFRVRNWSTVLAEGFVAGEEFVHVIVRNAPDPEVLRV